MCECVLFLFVLLAVVSVRATLCSISPALSTLLFGMIEMSVARVCVLACVQFLTG
jgi:hypothetical protein